MSENNVKYKLKGHASFIIREGWLNKGISAVDNDNSVFVGKKSADILGVGSNMAQSIKFWLKACKLVEDKPGKWTKLTELGELINKYDPYFEDIFTLWVMHCNIVKNSELVTSWHLFFNKCEAEDYAKDQIYIQLRSALCDYIFSDSFSEPSLKDDLNAIINTYAKQKDNDYDPENNNRCPLAELGLLKVNKNKYTKCQPDLSKLNPMIILYLITDQIGGKESISIDQLQEGDNSIGKVLNFGRIIINKYLDRLEEMNYITINRTAGLDMVYIKRKIKSIDVLKLYYKKNSLGELR